MRLRVVSATALALSLIAVAAVPRPAFSQTDDNPAPGTASSEVEPTSTAPPAPDAPRVEVAKPKPRVRPKSPAPTTQSNFFGEFSLLRLFGISAVPRSTVAFSGNYKPGTIVVRTDERRLYLVLGNGEALRYGIGVGRVGFTWKGVRTVSEKREWPAWTPPPQMLTRRPDLPRHMAGGRDNPLGARAMYLGIRFIASTVQTSTTRLALLPLQAASA